MRAVLTLLLAASALSPSACIPDKGKEPEWQKPPSSFDPAGADLTFNKKRLEAFNVLNAEQRDAFIEDLKAKPKSFKGQAQYKQGSGIGEHVETSKWGAYESFAIVPEPVLFEIGMEYYLYSTPEIAKNLPPHGYIEFTGTLVQMDYQADSKPRKMVLRVKADDIRVLKD